MTWLLDQLWPVLLLCAATGALLTSLLMTTRVTVERYVPAELPEPPLPTLAALDATGRTGASAETGAEDGSPGPDSPFPSLPGRAPDDRPWEAEELWSRPARLAAGSGRRRSGDDWSDAAANWRSWAEEAAGRAVVERGSDHDLFAADREADRALVGEPEPADAEEDVDFPFARPVEA